jgi:hypothetical protein
MSGNNSNLSTVDGQQAAVTKMKEDNTVPAAQAAVATAHREHEALIAVVAAARKTPNGTGTRECHRPHLGEGEDHWNNNSSLLKGLRFSRTTATIAGSNPDRVYLLNKSLYRLKQPPRA